MGLVLELRRRQSREPFEPIRVKLINGNQYDLADPQAFAVQEPMIWLTFPDQHWAILPIDKINSVESLIADFDGESQAAGR